MLSFVIESDIFAGLPTPDSSPRDSFWLSTGLLSLKSARPAVRRIQNFPQTGIFWYLERIPEFHSIKEDYPSTSYSLMAVCCCYSGRLPHASLTPKNTRMFTDRGTPTCSSTYHGTMKKIFLGRLAGHLRHVVQSGICWALQHRISSNSLRNW